MKIYLQWFVGSFLSGLFIIFLFKKLQEQETKKEINKYHKYVKKYAELYNLEEALVLAIIKAESEFNPYAVSPKGAIGLMQVLPSTAREIANILQIPNFKKERLFDPELNIKFGCFYLAYLRKKFDSFPLVIAAYNCGFNRLKEWIAQDKSEISLFPYYETKHFTKKVLRNYKFYQKLLKELDGYK